MNDGRQRILSASILSADFGRLTQEVQAVTRAGADWIHVDIMDGHFVPDLTFGPQAVAAVRRATDLPMDVHLMIERPEDRLRDYIEAGADWLGVHVEAVTHLHRVVRQIRALGAKASVAITPATPLAAVENVISEADMILVMTVDPGFSGQDFIPTMLPKIRQCRDMIDGGGHNVLLKVDGGVDLDTIGDLAGAGADVFVVGSAIFGDGRYEENIRELKERMHRNPVRRL